MRTSISKHVQNYHAGLRASGLRPVRIWVPDTRSPGFAEECRCQSRLLRSDPEEPETSAWPSTVADIDGWE